MPSVAQTAPAVLQCPHCGAEVPADADHCPSCGRVLHERSAKITLAITLLFLLAGFALTHYFVALHRATELGLARRWFARGEQAMQTDPRFAADAYRTALNYNRENGQYRLRLAQALVADHRLAEAHAHLLSLWEEEPADGEVNLTLARLEAQRGHSAEAVRYYNDAINGVWPSDARQHRIAVRFELARYLMQQWNWARAQAELLAALADAPADPADKLLLGQMLLQVNDPQHALQAYNAVLSEDHDNAQACLGASQAYLAMGNYAEAERASAKAVEHNPNLEAARNQLELTREIRRINSAERGLPLAERAERAARAFDAAFTRVDQCARQENIKLTAPGVPAPEDGANPTTSDLASPNTLQLLYTRGLQKQAEATAKALRMDPDAIEPTMQYALEVERTLAAVCHDMSLTDRALLTLAQHESEALK